MSFKLYNRAFKIGVGVNIILFVILNVLSYMAAQKRIQFSGGNSWGFPFPWTPGGDPLALIVNVTVIAMTSFALGFLFRYVSRKVSQ